MSAPVTIGMLDCRKWRARIELANAIYEYPETLHNRHRRHTGLGMHTLIEHARHHSDNTTLTPLIQVN